MIVRFTRFQVGFCPGIGSALKNVYPSYIGRLDSAFLETEDNKLSSLLAGIVPKDGISRNGRLTSGFLTLENHRDLPRLIFIFQLV
jgi:hypothetical protein